MAIRNYVGARYVPKFADPVEWQANTSYEAMVIVTYNNSSYTSKVPVSPTVGNPANNPQYWALTGNYNAQVEQYRQETENYNAQVEQYRQETENVKINYAKCFNTAANMIADTSLTEGMIVKTLGYNKIADNGGAFYKIYNTKEQNSEHYENLSNGKYALLIPNGYITPEMFGAIGDGQTDDTLAIQRALDNGGIILLQEKDYLVTSTLKVDVSKASLQGISGKSRLISDVGSNIETVLFYSTSKDFLERYKRERTHGHFRISGKTPYTYTPNGIKVGGDVDTEYEGAAEMQTFEGISFEWVNKAIILNAHAYNDTFFRCNANSAVYSVYSDSIRDTGECLVFNNCGFWSGHLDLRHTCNFYGCTIHTLEGRPRILDNGLSVDHVIEANCVFTNCHFERLSHAAQSYNKGIGIYITRSVTVFQNCEGTADDFKENAVNLIKTNETLSNLVPCKAILKDCDFQFLISRFTFDEAVFSGNVILNGIFTLNDPNHENGNILFNDDGYYFGNENDEYDFIDTTEGITIKTTKNSDGSYNIKVSSDKYYEGASAKVGFIAPVSSHRSLYVWGSGTVESGGIRVGLGKSNTFSGVQFLDANKRIISYDKANIPTDAQQLDANKSTLQNRGYNIPSNAVYVKYGVYIFTGPISGDKNYKFKIGFALA